MPFELRPDQNVRKRLRKVVRQRIDKCLHDLRGNGRMPGDEAVHHARRRLKQIRSTVRLVRAELGGRTFRHENDRFRDLGRPLSAVRDAKVMVQTLDSLIERFGRHSATPALRRLRKELLERHESERNRVLGPRGARAAMLRQLTAARKRAKAWTLDHRGFKAIETGLCRIYASARKAMPEAGKGCSDDALHEWRKRTQDLRYALELLKPMWPRTVGSLEQEVHHLSDLLGDDHDLAVLKETATRALNGRSARAAIAESEAFSALVQRRRKELQRQARVLGQKLYQEDEDVFIDRLKGYWRASRDAAV
jgi:CHAD domain-containing protein